MAKAKRERRAQKPTRWQRKRLSHALQYQKWCNALGVEFPSGIYKEDSEGRPDINPEILSSAAHSVEMALRERLGVSDNVFMSWHTDDDGSERMTAYVPMDDLIQLAGRLSSRSIARTSAVQHE